MKDPHENCPSKTLITRKKSTEKAGKAENQCFSACGRRVVSKIIRVVSKIMKGEMRMVKKKSVSLLKRTDLYCEAERRLRELTEVKQKKEDMARNAPIGKIRIANVGNRIQFYLREDNTVKSGVYIPKSDTSKIREYVQKSYDEKLLRLLGREIHTLERFIKDSGDIADRIRMIYTQYPDEVKEYIEAADMADEDYLKLWESIPFEGKEIADYVTVYETKKGERVRSKSELNIANALAAKGIPYKYECPLILKNGTKIYPDFTVLNIKERRELYWEHRGMMDDKEYAAKSVLRIKSYMKNGIFTGQNLIITEETSAYPLGTNDIDIVIKAFFG